MSKDKNNKAPENWREIAGTKRKLFEIVVQFTTDEECLIVLDKIDALINERVKQELTKAS